MPIFSISICFLFWCYSIFPCKKKKNWLDLFRQILIEVVKQNFAHISVTCVLCYFWKCPAEPNVENWMKFMNCSLSRHWWVEICRRMFLLCLIPILFKNYSHMFENPQKVQKESTIEHIFFGFCASFWGFETTNHQFNTLAHSIFHAVWCWTVDWCSVKVFFLFFRLFLFVFGTMT